jgi:hypothetical protein
VRFHHDGITVTTGVEETPLPNWRNGDTAI